MILDNPKYVAQMKQSGSLRMVLKRNLGKNNVATTIKDTNGDIATHLSSDSSLQNDPSKNTRAMQNAVCNDGRAHGMFQFYGANRSGVGAGRLIQSQNLPQNHLPDLGQDAVRQDCSYW